MGTFTKTHPWIQFSCNLSAAPPKLWLMLGECQSKCEHIAQVPMRPSTAKELYKIYLAKGVLASTAIEGNTLSEQEVLDHLEGKLKLPPSREYLAKEIDNIVGECNRMLRAIVDGRSLLITKEHICSINKMVLKELPLEEGIIPGVIRAHSVVVGKYRGVPAKECEALVDKLVDWLNGPDFIPADNLEISYAIIKAVLAHLYINWIHPFGDGNGRTARLIEFQILLSAKVPAPSAHILSNHYNLTKAEYYRQLDHASRSGGNIIPFLLYAVEGFLDGIRQQIEMVLKQQLDITWRNYVHEYFRDKTSHAHTRRRHLVLDLSLQTESVPIGKITEISPRVAKEYATLTHKTLMRDLNEMLRANLLEKTKGGYRARKEIILSFLPPRAQE